MGRTRLRRCAHCGREFTDSTNVRSRKYCSRGCSNRSRTRVFVVPVCLYSNEQSWERMMLFGEVKPTPRHQYYG